MIPSSKQKFHNEFEVSLCAVYGANVKHEQSVINNSSKQQKLRIKFERVEEEERSI